ncbi:MAG: transcriptional regulator PpsR [Pseudomonadota bacterium]
MDTITPKSISLRPFENAEEHLSNLGPDVVASIASSAADLALLVKDGVIEDISVATDGLADEGFDQDWRGQPWIETVTPESRAKVNDLLNEKAVVSRWRQVNHPSVTALDVPVRYTAIRLGTGNRLLVLGRDMRTEAKLQQRLVEAHQDLERDYTRLREAEARYRLLFEAVSEPVLIVNANAMTIDEANSSAGALLGRSPKALSGLSLASLSSPTRGREIERIAGEALVRGSSQIDGVALNHGGTVTLHMSAFREDRASRLIVRLVGSPTRDLPDGRAKLFQTLELLPDALIVVDSDQRIIAANQAFFDLIKIVGRSQAQGAQLGQYLGRSSTDLNVLFSTLRNHGVAKNYATVMRDSFGEEEGVEVSAVAAPADGRMIYGLSIRNVSRRLTTGARISEQLPQSVEQVTGQVGRVPLKDIVRESTELIEKLCIEAALEITDHNRASAAEMLGLSRQGLYSKLKRSGIDPSS